MKLETVLMDSPLYFECPISGEVIIDEDNEICNEPSSATEFVFYDGEFEFQKDWVKKAYEKDIIDFIQLESKESENVVCFELIMGSGASLERVYVGIRK